jgi:hypothetical protein
MKINEENVSITIFRALVEVFKGLKSIRFVLFAPSHEFKVREQFILKSIGYMKYFLYGITES